MNTIPTTTASRLNPLQLRDLTRQAQSTQGAGEITDQVDLRGAAPATEATASGPTSIPRPKSPGPQALASAAQEAAHQSLLGAALGACWGAVLKAGRAVHSALAVKDFALNFMGDLRRRAEEITDSNAAVQGHLKAQGMHHEYHPPVNHTNVKLVGTMTIRANMAEFFQLWHSWIDQGFGSINDRQYADLVLKYCDQAKAHPILAHVPMVSEDAFQVVMQDGRMTAMTETTTNKFAGILPTSKVHWSYARTQEPTASNSFENTIDKFNGDIEKVEQFYQNLFDPRRLNPDSKATVDFKVKVVDEVDVPQGQTSEFVHSVSVPLGGLFSKPASTLGSSQRSLATQAAAAGTPGPAAGVALGRSIQA